MSLETFPPPLCSSALSPSKVAPQSGPSKVEAPRKAQFQASALRSSQYSLGSMRIFSARSVSTSLPTSASKVSAPALEATWSGVAAPESTSGAKGCASTAAKHTWSAAAPSLAAASATGPARGPLRSRPFAIASLTITSNPSVRASNRASPTDCSIKLYVAWTQSKRQGLAGLPSSMRHASATRSVAAWWTPERLSPSRTPREVLSCLSSPRTSGSARTPLSSVAEWIWYSRRCFPSSARVSADCDRRCPTE
mmetsp:Transcript_58190/g.138519  ORF Transcript_58190/g.138519 Transcript_58190/m.138519 type:complete len:252 (-) Transcript_58190:135-890(-)